MKTTALIPKSLRALTIGIRVFLSTFQSNVPSQSQLLFFDSFVAVCLQSKNEHCAVEAFVFE